MCVIPANLLLSFGQASLILSPLVQLASARFKSAPLLAPLSYIQPPGTTSEQPLAGTTCSSQDMTLQRRPAAAAAASHYCIQYNIYLVQLAARSSCCCTFTLHYSQQTPVVQLAALSSCCCSRDKPQLQHGHITVQYLSVSGM